MPALAGPIASYNEKVGDSNPTDGVMESAEAAHPTTPDETEAQKKYGSHDDPATIGPTKSTVPYGSLSANRKDSLRLEGEVTHLDNSQSPDVGAVTKEAIHVKRHGVEMDRQIAYE